MVKLPLWRRVHRLTTYYAPSIVLSNSHAFALTLHSDIIWKVLSPPFCKRENRTREMWLHLRPQGPEWDSEMGVSGSVYIHLISSDFFHVELRWFVLSFIQEIFEHLHDTLGPAVYKSWTGCWRLSSEKNRVHILQSSWGERQTQTKPTS